MFPGLRVFACLVVLAFTFGFTVHSVSAAVSEPDQRKPGEPTNPKARKTYQQAFDWEKHRNPGAAIDSFFDANKQDDGHCVACLSNAFTLAYKIGDLKDAETAVRDWMPLAKTDSDRAGLHYRLGIVLQWEAITNRKKENCFNESCDEFKAATRLDPKLVEAHYSLGVSLAHLHQDDAARAEFKSFLDRDPDNTSLHERAQRFANNVELARAKMAPPFRITTIDGKQVSMDSLAGKVVLIDFWATWCGPCRQALPHMKEIVKKFDGQPFVALSVSLDKDESKWKDFVAKNGMTWMQARDAGFDGPVSTLFNVKAIPATFSIDADGVMEDQHVGDANIEGKLKKMIARSVELANQKSSSAATPANSRTTESLR